MAEENQITIFTDFDKTMIKQNSPINFIIHGFVKHPVTTVKDVLRAFYTHGTGGKGFLAAISRFDNKTREAIADKVVDKLYFNRNWMSAIMELVKKNPNIKNIKLVIVTRNISVIAKKFMQRQGNSIKRLTHRRFKGDYRIIGNLDLENTNVNWPDNRSISLPDIINRSHEKSKFIKSRNAFFFGDKEEYNELRYHSGLINLRFFRV